jgi:single-strand DNA-binding protein
MAATNFCRVVLTANLTKPPRLIELRGGAKVCELRVACTTRRKDPDTGAWGDKPNYYNVKAWGTQGEACARYLKKGSPVAVDGRLDWREYEKDGVKHEVVDVIADAVQFLGSSENGAQPPAAAHADLPL